MALFGMKTKKSVGDKKVAAAKPAQSTPSSSVGRDLSHVLRHARITEKATMHSAGGVYTFNVAVSATKRDIMQAMKALYSVTPRKVRVVTIPKKSMRSRTGQMGIKGGGKKAYVYLKKGETITIG